MKERPTSMMPGLVLIAAYVVLTISTGILAWACSGIRIAMLTWAGWTAGAWVIVFVLLILLARRLARMSRRRN